MKTADRLLYVHQHVQELSRTRRDEAQTRTELARQAQAEGMSIPDIQDLLGLSRTGVVKILAGAKGSSASA